MKLEFVCVEESSCETGQKVYLTVPLPPPLPVADGYGNPIAHPPPPSGQLKIFVTSEERQAALRHANVARREAKKIRPEMIEDPEARKVAEQEKAKFLKHADKHVADANGAKEFRFEHGARYIITVEKAK